MALSMYFWQDESCCEILYLILYAQIASQNKVRDFSTRFIVPKIHAKNTQECTKNALQNKYLEFSLSFIQPASVETIRLVAVQSKHASWL